MVDARKTSLQRMPCGIIQITALCPLCRDRHNIHWTAPAHRCDRDLSGRFGSNSYAVEELVAELGAAFLCAEIGISSAPRADHADYIASWLKCLKADNRAIFKAAAQASRAADFVQSMSATR